MINKAVAGFYRKAIESGYDGICTVYEYQSITDPETHFTSQEEVVQYENKPCHLSFESISSAQDGGGAAVISQAVKLFCAPELDIKPGSVIEVTQAGHTETYKRSGKGAVYASHQEIPLVLDDKYAGRRKDGNGFQPVPET